MLGLVLALASICFGQSIDVVIPSTRKDLLTLETTIARLRRFSRTKVDRVVVVSPENLTANAEWWPETKGYPFTRKDFARGANYQQMLKMYALDAVKPPLGERVLILDSDVYWQREVSFLSDDGTQALYTV